MIVKLNVLGAAIETSTFAYEFSTPTVPLLAYFSLKTVGKFFGKMRRVTDVPGTVALRAALAEQIRSARKKCALSQEELAWRSGLHRTYISMIERAQRSPTVDSLEKIAAALGIPASTLLAGAEKSGARRPR